MSAGECFHAAAVKHTGKEAREKPALLLQLGLKPKSMGAKLALVT